VGGNAKMNEFQAAMGLCNLRRIGEDIAARKAVHEAYMEQLSGLPIGLTEEQPGVESNYAYFPAVFESRKTRDAVCEALAEAGVYARKYFYPLINDFECYRDQFDSSLTPVAKRMADGVVTLPMYSDLALEDVALICRVVREVLTHE
jgi:dTDP-4-amino-4,6-dideoxygalactose transaminase